MYIVELILSALAVLLILTSHEFSHAYAAYKLGDTTARNGKWDSAPGIELFRTIAEKFPKAKIIAEDLGFITDDVRALLDDAGFPGMKMLHFAFYDEDSENLPRMYETKNCVVYSASTATNCITSRPCRTTS